MKITASSRKFIDIGVDVALVSATIYTTGNNESVCKEQAVETAKEVVEQYSYDYANISNTAIEIDRVRCVDGKGIMSIEHRCVFEIHQSGTDLLCSLSALESICMGMSDSIRLIGWEVFPCKETMRDAIEKLISEVSGDAEFEARCMANAASLPEAEVSDIIIDDYNSDIIKDSIFLPDPSSPERDMVFERINQFVPLFRKLGRVATVVLSC